MVQFVKPNLLGTRKEFLNRFVNPITNGQFEDSTAHDVKVMKRRAHVLHKMLEGSVQVRCRQRSNPTVRALVLSFFYINALNMFMKLEISIITTIFVFKTALVINCIFC